MNYKEWLSINHTNKRTVQNYYRAIYGARVNEHLLKISNCQVPIYEVSDLQKLESLIFLLEQDPEFLEFDAKGHRMYSCGLHAFLKYRQELNGRDIVQEDLKIIEIDKVISETMKLELRQARVGQGNYRRNLLKLWSSKCAVTGYSDERFLIASHVKPWRCSSNIERLDKNNGLILTPNLDKAFDRGLITFASKNKQIIISDYLPKPELLGIHRDLRLRYMPDGLKTYLEFHEDVIFLKKVGR